MTASRIDGAFIQLRLAAIARELPPGSADGALPETLRISVPFAWIEPQLAKGAVELPRDRFVESLPVEWRPRFHLAENVSLPLEEILLNLPGNNSSEETPPTPSAPAPDIKEIAGLIRALPGLEGCVLLSGTNGASAGEVPVHPDDVRKIASSLDGAGMAATFLVRDRFCLCVFHGGGRVGFEPGVLEKLDSITGKMAKGE